MAQGKLIGFRCSYVAINYHKIFIIAENAKIGLLKLFMFSFFATKQENVAVSYLSLAFNRSGRMFLRGKD